MAFKKITKEQAIAGRKLKSFALTAGFFPTVKYDSNQDYRVGMYKYGRSPARHHFVTVEGVNVMAQEPVTNSAWRLAGNHVWYQYGGRMAIEGQTRLKKFLELEDYAGEDYSSLMKRINKLGFGRQSLTRKLNLDHHPIKGGPYIDLNSEIYGDSPWVQDEDMETPDLFRLANQIKENELADKEFFKKLYRVFASNANKESVAFLSNLNKQLRSEVKKSLSDPNDTGISKTLGQTETVPLTGGSRMSEEQASVSEFGRPQEAGIGATEPMDTTYYTLGGNIYIDVSDMPISQGGQHGIGPDGIKLKAKNLTDAEAGSFGGVKDEIYEHFQERIGVFNTTIARIRQNARELSGKEQVSAEEMRRAGFSGTWNASGTMTQGDRYTTSTGGRAPALAHARHRRRKSLEQASATANAVMANLMTTGALKWSDKSAVDFTLHALGTYNNHHGNYYHGMTVNRDPHITASVRFRMFAADHANRAFEYRKLNKKRDVIVSFGYASLEILRRRNMLNTANYVNHVKKQKDLQTGARYLKGVRRITLNGVSHGNFRGGEKFKNSTCKISGTDRVIKRGGFGSAAVHIPQGWSDQAIENAIELLSEHKTGGFRPAQQGAFAHTNKLDVKLKGLQASARKDGFTTRNSPQNVPVYWPKQVSFWATPYYGYALSGGLDPIGE